MRPPPEFPYLSRPAGKCCCCKLLYVRSDASSHKAWRSDWRMLLCTHIKTNSRPPRLGICISPALGGKPVERSQFVAGTSTLSVVNGFSCGPTQSKHVLLISTEHSTVTPPPSVATRFKIKRKECSALCQCANFYSNGSHRTCTSLEPYCVSRTILRRGNPSLPLSVEFFPTRDPGGPRGDNYRAPSEHFPSHRL